MTVIFGWTVPESKDEMKHQPISLSQSFCCSSTSVCVYLSKCLAERWILKRWNGVLCLSGRSKCALVLLSRAQPQPTVSASVDKRLLRARRCGRYGGRHFEKTSRSAEIFSMLKLKPALQRKWRISQTKSRIERWAALGSTELHISPHRRRLKLLWC